MGRVNLFVSVLLMLSAISLVTARYQARQLFVELDRSRALARELDQMTAEKGYDNRSLAIADMIRDQLVEHRQQQGPARLPAASRWFTIITNTTCKIC